MSVGLWECGCCGCSCHVPTEKPLGPCPACGERRWIDKMQAAAQWRRLENGERIEEGDEYLDQCEGWTPVPRWGMAMNSDFNPHRRRVPPPDHRDLLASVAELRERVSKIEEAMVSGSTWFPKSDQPAPPPPPAPPQPAPVPPADGLRTERVTLEITQRAESYAPCHDLDWQRMLRQTPGGLFPGESVRVVEEEWVSDIDRVLQSETTLAHTEIISALTAERNAARDECERLRRVMDCHARMDIDKEIAVEEAWEFCDIRPHWPEDEPGTSQRYAESMRLEIVRLRARLAELEATPAANAGGEGNHQESLDSSPPPRGWLTPNERKVLTKVADEAEQSPSKERWAYVASCVRGLLARSTPPKVKLPPEMAEVYDAVSVRNAIRAAGGEVE